MKRFNKFLALFLVVVMTVGMLPAGVSAATVNSGNVEVVFEEDFEDYAGKTLAVSEMGHMSTSEFNSRPYFAGTNPVVTTGTTGAKDGSTGMLLQASEGHSATGSGRENYSHRFDCFGIRIPAAKFEHGRKYQISAWFKSEVNGSPGMNYIWYAGYNGTSRTTSVEQRFAGSVEGGYSSVEFTYDEAWYDVEIFFGGCNFTNDANGYVIVDDVSVVKLDANVLFADSFEEISALDPSAYNIKSPYFEGNFGGGTYEISTDAYTGSQSIKLLPKKVTSSKYYKENGVTTDRFVEATGWVGLRINTEDFVEGAEYKISAWVKASNDEYPAYLWMQAKENTTTHTLYNDKISVGTDWTLVEYVFKMPKITDANVRFRIGSGYYNQNLEFLTGYYMLVDDISITKVYDYNNVVNELAAGDAKLQADVNGTGNDLVLKSGKTLDLAGYTLTVDSLTALKGANIVDTVGGGKLIVDKEDLLLQKTNSYLPVKVDGGYTFVSIKTQHEQLDDGVENTLKYKSKPSFGSSYLADGAADNGLSIILRLTWTNASNGTTTTMDVPCSEEIIKQVYAADSDNAFILTVKGVDNVENLKVATVVCSDTGVAVVGEALAYTAG